ncbi:ParB N-terminal domain-containing protein [Chondromyces apiculatus]|uniref:ParB-like N-terminal domain-containing protein n=1 Tax=Chondromyces apiculatus DSM 436 TaxID=1192034 RepID=A0A017TH87_9BACT|nr:ParB N-terminal domain-containing protein [Chondromyces apiculatus]EYF08589.1 Hypothetical protein CAP_4119 [Chondromyces apiculatus DSM 436]
MVDGPNLYAYVSANPIRLHDPNGRWGLPSLQEVQATLSRAGQSVSSVYGKTTAAAARAYDATAEVASRAANTAATAAAKHVLIPAVETIFGGSAASAPTTTQEAREAPKAQTYTEQAVGIVASTTGGVVGSKLLGAAISRFGLSAVKSSGFAVAAGAGSGGSVGSLAGNDIMRGEVSSAEDYLGATVTGAVLGIAYRGAGQGLGKAGDAMTKAAHKSIEKAAPVVKEIVLAPAGLFLGTGPGGRLPRLPSGKATPDSMMVNPRALRPTHEVDSRSAVDNLKKKLTKEGFDPTQPIQAVEVEGSLYITDGHHRTAASIKANIKEVPVEVRQPSTQMEAEQLFRDYAGTLQGGDRGF